MRIDVLSIFPDYFAPLALSLPGKAQAAGILDFHAHDLRAWTHDRHHTVDDTPYGGGAGMVMKPEPWGEAFDALELGPGDTVVFTTPSGELFTQRKAQELATRQRLVFACGRYEGIDQRVVDYARQVAQVEEISLGDYVLNGGEVAALAITEAVVRLLPGFMGNPHSLVEESHSDGLLEYPAYTKPVSWRDLEVPDVLLSGDHGAIELWRQHQARQRTAERRPDLLPPHALLDDPDLEPALASAADAAELLLLTRATFIEDALADPGLPMPQFRETVEDTVTAMAQWRIWVVRHHGRLVGSVRARPEGEVWHIARVMVAPDLTGRGVGRALLAFAEAQAPASTTSYVLEAATANDRNQRFYKKAGYRATTSEGLPAGLGRLAKRRR
ncbi:MAG: tRNA (guanosine(37)-N1)-methyltransferase TrmD [Marmoricola sp.]